MSKLTPEQRAKQKAGLEKHHKDGREGKANTSAGTFRPRKNKSLKTLADKMSEMLPKALGIIQDVLDGKEVEKTKAEMAKYVANNAVTLTKAQMQEDADILKLKVDYAKAVEANIVSREDPQEVAKALAAEGKHIQQVSPLSHLEDINHFPEEEEFFAADAEEDEENN